MTVSNNTLVAETLRVFLSLLMKRIYRIKEVGQNCFEEPGESFEAWGKSW